MSQSQSNDRILYKFQVNSCLLLRETNVDLKCLQELTGLNVEDCIYFLKEYNWNLQVKHSRFFRIYLTIFSSDSTF